VAVGRVIQGDNLTVLGTLADGSAHMVYVDPPFNTGQAQERLTLKTRRDPAGTRTGFQGRTYSAAAVGRQHYPDSRDDYLGWLGPRLVEGRRVLADTGTFYLHLDYREVHYAKVLMDEVFGRDCFLNEIVWAYDYGARTTSRWPAKHDNILVYVKDRSRYHFDSAAVDREPYMAPGLVTAEKAARGKLPTDVWWHTIVSPTGREKTGYPSQKPVAILRRMIAASTKPGETVLDFFAGSGTTGAAAMDLGRAFILVDESPQAVEVMRTRLGDAAVTYEVVTGPGYPKVNE
jgi:site-specific DNA-methyltransferase (adenine-specific)